ncbi:CHAT domain-containing protein [Nonomuraea sp. NPDC001636]|uniref:CHAT domain-containing protein n=1 Tax=Nonomuraea sp. NPDC001636 TaxID=3154391 RepID=UPI0033313226
MAEPGYDEFAAGQERLAAALRTDDVDGMRAAIELFEQALRLMPEGHHARPKALTSMASTLNSLATLLHDPALRDRAAETIEQAVNESGGEPSELTTATADLIAMRRAGRFDFSVMRRAMKSAQNEAGGAVAHLVEATRRTERFLARPRSVWRYRKAVAAAEAVIAHGSPQDGTDALERLLIIHLTRYRATGHDAAIEAAEATAARRTGPDTEASPVLATIDWARYERTGDQRYLDATITAARRHPKGAALLSEALRRRFELLGDSAARAELMDLEADDPGAALMRAVTSLDDAPARTDIDDVAPVLRAVMETTEGTPFEAALRRLLHALDANEDARPLINALEHELSAYPGLSEMMAAPLGMMRALTAARHGDQAAELLFASVADLPGATSRNRADALAGATAAALDRVVLGGGGEKALQAAAARTDALLAFPGSSPAQRVKAARLLADAAAGSRKWALAARMYEGAVQVLPELAGRRLGRTDQERRLRDHTHGLAVSACAAALMAGDPDRALGLLESARGILLGQAMETRFDPADLPGELASELESARRDLAAADLTGADRHAPAARWERAVSAVRAVEGFERFGLPPAAATLIEAAAGGPVVALAASPWRADALILRKDGIQVVPLPSLDHDEARDRQHGLMTALRALPAHPSAVDRHSVNQRLEEVLDWLWDAVVGPVLGELTPGERVWWVPSGVLTGLPLHAAGAAPETVISSYSPTISALLHARSRAASQSEGMLLVGADEPGFREELTGLAGKGELLVGDAETVLARLPEYGSVHFACHGRLDDDHPSAGYLELAGGSRLTVAAVERARVRAGATAYLSACDTAAAGGGLLDEGLHLASAFQLAGYSHVVGTLWPISHLAGQRMTKAFYAARPGDRARALHEARLEVRAAAPTPFDWAAHIHLGP